VKELQTVSAEPKITVLTPTFNRPAYLPQAIGSVIAQSRADWEMLVINDGGVDVRQVVEGFGEPRVRYYHREQNGGKAACLNFGLARARGEYVAYLDDDDAWYPDHLETLARVLDERPGVGVAYSDLYKTVVVADSLGRRYPLEKRVDICRDYNRMFMFHFNHTLHVSLMHRKDLALRAGGYDESVRVLIDWDLTRKLSFRTDFVHVPKVTGEYFVPISRSDRISDVQRRDKDSYRHNLRRIRADLPPEPWPMVKKVAVILPVRRWDAGTRQVLEYLVDKVDYPVRFVLVDAAPAADAEARREALAELAEVTNLRVIAAPPGVGEHEAYLTGARSIEAECYYLPSPALSLREDMRVIRALCYMREAGCGAVRWAGDAAGDYDVFLTAQAAFGDRPPWPEARVVPPDWYPEDLRADLMMGFSRECERQGDYVMALHFLGEAAGVRHGGVGDAFLAQRLADISFAMGDYDQAEKMCQGLVAEGYGADNYVRLGRIYQGRGEHERAADAYRRGLKAIGLEVADMEADVFPLTGPVEFDVFRATVGLGECLVALGRPAEAAPLLRRAARLHLTSPRPNIAFGRMFLAQGDLASAQEAFALAASQSCGAVVVEIEAGLAEVLEPQGQTQAAFERCGRALSKAPQDAALLERAARLAGMLGADEEMARIYRRFLDHRPGHVPALAGLAALCARMGLDEEAAELKERAALLSSAAEPGGAARGLGKRA
jgi:glycosyltransferase involved in cell wall biosynthesis/tetratricopeptide (TPR) repeat protein